MIFFFKILTFLELNYYLPICSLRFNKWISDEIKTRRVWRNLVSIKNLYEKLSGFSYSFLTYAFLIAAFWIWMPTFKEVKNQRVSKTSKAITNDSLSRQNSLTECVGVWIWWDNMTSEFQLSFFLLFHYFINRTAGLKKTRHTPFKMWWQASHLLEYRFHWSELPWYQLSRSIFSLAIDVWNLKLAIRWPCGI